jgi:hypothetical protein
MDKDNPAGYIDFVALNKKGLDSLLSGKFRDGEVIDYADPEQDGNDLNLYVASVAILLEYRGHGIVKDIWNFEISYFKTNNIKIKGMYGTIWTEEGRKFASNYLETVVCKDVFGREVVKFKI